MRKLKFTSAFLLVILLVFLASPVSHARWSGSQSVTWEYLEEVSTIYTSVLNLEVKDSLHLTFVLDKHPRLGTAVDLSATIYLPVYKLISATAGARKVLFDRESGTVPYVTLIFAF